MFTLQCPNGKADKNNNFSLLTGLPSLTTECGEWLVSGWPEDQSQAGDGFFQTLSWYFVPFHFS